MHPAPTPFDAEQSAALHVGVPEIDAQHRELLDHYRALVRALHDGDDVTAFGLSLYSLLVKVRAHFAEEERLMDAMNYPGRVRHRQQHQKLVATAEDFLGSVINRFERYDCEAVAKYFKYWLIDHVMHHDRALADYVRGAYACRGLLVVS